MLIMKKSRREIREQIELPNQKSIRTLKEKENYKFKGILEVDTFKETENEEK